MDIQVLDILFQFVNFGVVAFALTYLLVKPVSKMLADRSAAVAAGVKAAEENIAERKQLEELRKKAQKQAEKEAAQVLDEANKAATAKAADVLKKAKETAAKEVEKMKADAKEDMAASKAQLKKEFHVAVTKAVGEIVGSLDLKAQQKIIDANLDQLLQRV